MSIYNIFLLQTEVEYSSSPRPKSANLPTTRYNSSSRRRSWTTLQNSQLLDAHHDRSFSSKRSSTPISYRSACDIKQSRSNCSTPRYKIEMYSADPDLPALKGSLFNTSSSVMADNNWKRSRCDQGRTPRETSLKLDLSSLSLTESIGGEYIEESSKLCYKSSLSERSPEYKRLQQQEELM